MERALENQNTELDVAKEAISRLQAEIVDGRERFRGLEQRYLVGEKAKVQVQVEANAVADELKRRIAFLEKLVAAKEEKERMVEAHERQEGLENYVDMKRRERGEMEQVREQDLSSSREVACAATIDLSSSLLRSWQFRMNIRGPMHQLIERNEQQRRQLEKKDADLEQLRRQVEVEKEAGQRALEGMQAAATMQAEEYQRQMDELNRQLSTIEPLKQAMVKMKEQNTELEKMVERQTQDIREKAKAVEEAREGSKKTEANNKALAAKSAEFEGQIQSLKEELSSTLKKLEATRQSLKEKEKEREDKKAADPRRASAAASEKDRELKSKLSELEGSVKALQKEQRADKDMIDRLKAQLEKAKAAAAVPKETAAVSGNRRKSSTTSGPARKPSVQAPEATAQQDLPNTRIFPVVADPESEQELQDLRAKVEMWQSEADHAEQELMTALAENAALKEALAKAAASHTPSPQGGETSPTASAQDKTPGSDTAQDLTAEAEDSAAPRGHGGHRALEPRGGEEAPGPPMPTHAADSKTDALDERPKVRAEVERGAQAPQVTEGPSPPDSELSSALAAALSDVEGLRLEKQAIQVMLAEKVEEGHHLREELETLQKRHAEEMEALAQEVRLVRENLEKRRALEAKQRAEALEAKQRAESQAEGSAQSGRPESGRRSSVQKGSPKAARRASQDRKPSSPKIRRGSRKSVIEEEEADPASEPKATPRDKAKDKGGDKLKDKAEDNGEDTGGDKVGGEPVEEPGDKPAVKPNAKSKAESKEEGGEREQPAEALAKTKITLRKSVSLSLADTRPGEDGRGPEGEQPAAEERGAVRVARELSRLTGTLKGILQGAEELLELRDTGNFDEEDEDLLTEVEDELREDISLMHEVYRTMYDCDVELLPITVKGLYGGTGSQEMEEDSEDGDGEDGRASTGGDKKRKTRGLKRKGSKASGTIKIHKKTFRRGSRRSVSGEGEGDPAHDDDTMSEEGDSSDYVPRNPPRHKPSRDDSAKARNSVADLGVSYNCRTVGPLRRDKC
jgi:hypothetical protein